MPNLVPIRDAAREYGINRATLHRAVRDGRLTIYDGGLGDRKVYLDRDELDRLTKPTPRPRPTQGESKK
jgi:Helix-turn-helix domain